MRPNKQYRNYKMVDYRNRSVKYGIAKRPVDRQQLIDQQQQSTLTKRRATDTYLNTKLTRKPQRDNAR